MNRLAFMLLAVLPLIAVPAAFVAVLRSGPQPAPIWRQRLPADRHEPHRCTWSCHDRGCRHAPVLPAWLAADDGLFGATIQALGQAGRALWPRDPRRGYALANLLVFCVLWPGAMYALYLVALRQRRALGELREVRDVRELRAAGLGGGAPR
jgi:hypothetical protein